MDKFTEDTIKVELANIATNLKVLTAISNELKTRPDGYGMAIGMTLASLMDRLSNILDDMVDDTEKSILSLYALTNHEKR